MEVTALHGGRGTLQSEPRWKRARGASFLASRIIAGD